MSGGEIDRLTAENSILRELLNAVPIPRYRESMPNFKKRYAAWEEKRCAVMEDEKETTN